MEILYDCRKDFSERQNVSVDACITIGCSKTEGTTENGTAIVSMDATGGEARPIRRLTDMDFVVIPSNRSAFGLPQVKGRSWIAALVLIQMSHFACYHIVGRKHLRLFDDPFQCRYDCVPAQFAVLVDWFISSVSILVPMITDELLFDDSVYFSYHYIHFIRHFLLYRTLALAVLLPARGVPRWLLSSFSIVHFVSIVILLRIFYVLLREIERSKNSLIAIQLTFRFLIVISLVKVFRSIDGDSISLAPTITQTASAQFADVCPICFDPLTIGSRRNVTSASRTRVNTAATRPLSYGKLNVFTTSCHHSFHKDCLMKWISGKPIKVQLGINQAREDPHLLGPDPHRRSGASCPVCGRRIQLKIERKSKYLLEFLWNREL